jgi:hypothetical protein
MVNATKKELTDNEYEVFLNNSYAEVSILGSYYPVGYVLRRIDETAFNCSKNDYEDSLDIYVCSKCGKEHDYEEEAEQCCKEDE